MKTKKEWTFEECKRLAAGCRSKSEFAKKHKMACIAARENKGWMEKLFGTNRGDSATRNCHSYIVSIKAPNHETFFERHEWQRKTAYDIQKAVRLKHKTERPSIIVVEPLSQTTKGVQKFDVELTILNITSDEIKNFDENVKKIVSEFGF